MARMSKREARTQHVIDRQDFQSLFDVLIDRGFRLIGPTVRNGVIVYDQLASVADLPQGYQDEQEKGTYRLQQADNPQLFGFTVGPHSWKKYLYPPAIRLWQAQRKDGNFQLIPEQQEASPLALIGVRACELNAIAIQDRIFLGGEFVDPIYKAQREKLFIVAVNCGHAGNTCFCASMNTGPQATTGFDLALTEIVEAERHYFVLEAGSSAGEEVLEVLPHRAATNEEIEAASQVVAQTTASMGRSLDTHDIKKLLYANYDHPHWDEVATRCLACGNCTLVCPTCFCSTVEDVTDLTGDSAERWRKWDSCFTTDFSYIVGGSIRSSVKSRYRQWMTHKLATWIDQFGTSGCVGCGRCITWCPVGIDITEEMASIRAEQKTAVGADGVKEETP